MTPLCMYASANICTTTILISKHINVVCLYAYLDVYLSARLEKL